MARLRLESPELMFSATASSSFIKIRAHILPKGNSAHKRANQNATTIIPNTNQFGPTQHVVDGRLTAWLLGYSLSFWPFCASHTTRSLASITPVRVESHVLLSESRNAGFQTTSQSTRDFVSSASHSVEPRQLKAWHWCFAASAGHSLTKLLNRLSLVIGFPSCSFISSRSDSCIS